MDVIQRNFLRLLRCGAFGYREQLEPMSEWKWQRLYQLSQIHGVTPWIADGIHLLSGDFFLQLSPTLRQQFYDDTTQRSEPRETQELTNPLLNRKLKKLAEEAGPQDVTFSMLNDVIAIARNILTQGISLRQLIALGTRLRSSEQEAILPDLFKHWVDSLNMQQMARLEGMLLMQLFRFKADEIPFTDVEGISSSKAAHVVQDIFRLTEKKAADWYFTQGKSVFVRSNDSDAMMWHFKQSARYMHYYPSEAFTNFLSNLAHSLSHIEE